MMKRWRKGLKTGKPPLIGRPTNNKRRSAVGRGMIVGTSDTVMALESNAELMIAL